MNLAQIALYGVAGVPDCEMSLLDGSGEPLDFVAVTGGSGSGKTRLLEAIVAAKEAVASSGATLKPRHWVRDGLAAARISLVWAFDDEERMYGGLTERLVATEVVFSASAPQPETDEDDVASIVLARYAQAIGSTPAMFGVSGKLEYFWAGRALPSATRGSLDEGAQRPLRGARDNAKYAFVSDLSVTIAASTRRPVFEALLATFADGLRYDPELAGRGLPCFLTACGARCRASELGTTETNALLVAAVGAAIGLDRSVVLVDRPDRTRDAWRSIGTGTQIIAATAAPEMLRGLPRERVLDLG